MLILEPINLIPVWPVVGVVLAVSLIGGLVYGLTWCAVDWAIEWVRSNKAAQADV